ncbi:MAG: hypothetical protein GY862_17240 [Gammaproteobacteria bacterium]|nr:hypothetical protein [Gammaproteobacteria bacterium]
MRKFSSYGPIDPELHYHVPRMELADFAYRQLLGDNPDKGGHYITIWAPRQAGKTWIMREVFFKLRQDTGFDVVILSVQFLDKVTDVNRAVQQISRKLLKQLNLEKELTIDALDDFDRLFERGTLKKPLILILDEFDALPEAAISGLVSVFRHIYNTRQNQTDKPTAEKEYLLHGIALIGVHAVLGVENAKGSPFNVQRSLHIPNLTYDEVNELFNCYQQESGQSIEPDVVERVWYECQGQPGLTCWFGELLTETYNQAFDKPITTDNMKKVYAAALKLLPNNNILNVISKAKQTVYKAFVLELFQTETKIDFIYDDPVINFLYMNGIVTVEQAGLEENYLKFSCPYIQERLFNYFARELFHELSRLHDPFEDLSDTITKNSLNIRRLLQRYEQYFQANQARILKNAPRRREDLRVYEAVFHFHLYLCLTRFFRSYNAQVQPEFPTGNGAIDLLIRYAGQLFGLELKSFADQQQYRQALKQAAKYGKKLGLTSIWLVLFIDAVDDKNRQRFEVSYTDKKRGVTVHPLFVQTGTA